MNDMDSIVYFAQADYGGPIKIGCTVAREKRLYQIAREMPFNLVAIGSFPGTQLSERFVQLYFRKSRIKGEWFEPCPELMRWAYQARAHSRVHQVPEEPGQPFRASVQSLLYWMRNAGLTPKDIAIEAGVAEATAATEFEKPFIVSRRLLAAYAVLLFRRGHEVHWRSYTAPVVTLASSSAELQATGT